MQTAAASSFSQTFSAQANLAMSQGQAQGQSLSAPPASITSSTNNQDLRKAAVQFTGVFMSQMFSHMFEGIGTDTMFGGGQGEEMFRSVLTDEYGKEAAKQGAGGLTDKIMHALLAQQEVKS
jgi:Rod binding domain-containing protein